MAYDYESAHETLDEHTNTNLFRRDRLLEIRSSLICPSRRLSLLRIVTLNNWS